MYHQFFFVLKWQSQFYRNSSSIKKKISYSVPIDLRYKNGESSLILMNISNTKMVTASQALKIDIYMHLGLFSRIFEELQFIESYFDLSLNA